MLRNETLFDRRRRRCTPRRLFGLRVDRRPSTGSNLAFVGYAADPERDRVITMGVVEN